MTKIRNIIQLTKKEKHFLSSFSVMTDNEIHINEIFEIYSVEEDNKVDFFDMLHDLSKNGWLNCCSAKYAIDNEAQQEIKTKIPANLDNCSNIIESLSEIFLLPPKENYDKIKNQIIYAKRLITNVVEASNLLAGLANNLASFYEYIGEEDNSIFYLKKAIEIQQKSDNTHHELNFFYNNLSVVYLRRKEYKNCLNYTFKSINLSEQQHFVNYVTLANSYNIASSAFDKLKNYKSAINYNMMAIKIAEENCEEKSTLLANFYHDAAVTFLKLGNYDKANFFIEKAIKKYSIKKTDEDDFMQTLIQCRNFLNVSNSVVEKIVKYIKPVLLGLSLTIIAFILYYIFL